MQIQPIENQDKKGDGLVTVAMIPKEWEVKSKVEKHKAPVRSTAMLLYNRECNRIKQIFSREYISE